MRSKIGTVSMNKRSQTPRHK